MLIWINGAFGSGKTSAAYELHRLLPDSFVYDPEEIGYLIRRNFPKEEGRDDFQDYASWRDCNYSLLKEICSQYKGIVIAPMTLVVPQYFDEIVGRLRLDGLDVRHFALCASPETVRARLKKRGEGSASWAAKQIERCTEALADDRFRRHLDTDGLSVTETVQRIAGACGLELMPDRRSVVKRRLDRWKTQWNHIRWFR